MARQETYYYGQGKLYLARRDPYGKPLAWYWVGDVSALSIALTVENLTHKESYSGQKATVRRFNVGKDGTVTSTWHDHSPENLAIVLYASTLTLPAGTVTGEMLPDTVKAGERHTLAHQNVSDVEIAGLTPGDDFTVDPVYGAIEFLTTPATAPSVSYAHAGATNTALFNAKPEDLVMRYEGINLAENGAAVIAELYKVSFDPTSAMSLINTDTSLAGLETTAGILMDTARPLDALLGRFGRIIHVAESV